MDLYPLDTVQYSSDPLDVFSSKFLIFAPVGKVTDVDGGRETQQSSFRTVVKLLFRD